MELCRWCKQEGIQGIVTINLLLEIVPVTHTILPPPAGFCLEVTHVAADGIPLTPIGVPYSTRKRPQQANDQAISRFPV